MNAAEQDAHFAQWETQLYADGPLFAAILAGQESATVLDLLIDGVLAVAITSIRLLRKVRA